MDLEGGSWMPCVSIRIARPMISAAVNDTALPRTCSLLQRELVEPPPFWQGRPSSHLAAAMRSCLIGPAMERAGAAMAVGFLLAFSPNQYLTVPWDERSNVRPAELGVERSPSVPSPDLSPDPSPALFPVPGLVCFLACPSSHWDSRIRTIWTGL